MDRILRAHRQIQLLKGISHREKDKGQRVVRASHAEGKENRVVFIPKKQRVLRELEEDVSCRCGQQTIKASKGLSLRP